MASDNKTQETKSVDTDRSKNTEKFYYNWIV